MPSRSSWPFHPPRGTSLVASKYGGRGAHRLVCKSGSRLPEGGVHRRLRRGHPVCACLCLGTCRRVLVGSGPQETRPACTRRSSLEQRCASKWCGHVPGKRGLGRHVQRKAGHALEGHCWNCCWRGIRTRRRSPFLHGNVSTSGQTQDRVFFEVVCGKSSLARQGWAHGYGMSTDMCCG